MIKVTIFPFMNPSAYNNGQMAGDYLIDTVYHGFNKLDNVLVQQIPENPLMFDNLNKQEKSSLWGMGFTLYGLLPKNEIFFPVEDSDLIILALHHTAHQDLRGFHRATKDLISRFGKKVICIDGHDFPDFMDETAELCPYFKRELLDDRKAEPIFFGIPEEKLCLDNLEDLSLNKIYDFSPMVPANHCWNHNHVKSYVYKTEEEYYQQYQQSYFAYSCKKGGYATGRQNEIWANLCLPYITDIESYPSRCLYRYPKDLCQDIKRLKGVLPGTIHPFDPERNTFIGDTRQIKLGEERGRIDWDVFDVSHYDDIVREFYYYGKEFLTTKSLARYLLEKSL